MPPRKKKKTRAGRGLGGVYQRADGTWGARVQVHGKRHHATAPTEAEAWEALSGLRIKAAKEEGHIGKDPVLADWLEYWLTEICPTGRCRDSTIEGSYRPVVRNWIVPHLGHRRLSELTPAMVRSLYAAQRKAGLTSTMHTTHSVLRRSLKVAVHEGLLEPGQQVTARMDGPTVVKAKTKAFTTEQIKAVLTAAQAQPRNGSRWIVSLALGLRLGEVGGLTWDDIDLDAGRLTVARQLRRRRARHGCQDKPPTDGSPWACGKKQPIKCPTPAAPGGLVLAEPKSEKGIRILGIPPTLIRALQGQREQWEREKIEDGRTPSWEATIIRDGTDLERVETVHLVFARRGGYPIDGSHAWKEWTAMLAEAGIEHLRPHGARHTAGTQLLEGGIDPVIIAEILGHSDPGFTRRIYLHGTDALTTAASDAMERMLSPQAPDED
jgi:integrase